MSETENLDRRFLLGTLTGAAALATLAASRAAAGPLTPPAGPVTSTSKPLGEVEPRIAVNTTNTPGTSISQFAITQPGSYYLTGNIGGVAGKHGIFINSSGVTLDLNGFTLNGSGVSGNFDGVYVVSPGFFITLITIRNGHIRNWPRHGVNLMAGPSQICVVESVHAAFNGGDGITTYAGERISDCNLYENAGVGLRSNDTCLASRCVAMGNNAGGFALGPGSLVTECVATFNDSRGFNLLAGCSIIGCTAIANAGAGIQLSDGCTALHNTCRANTGSGVPGILALGSRNRIEANHCTSGAVGILIGDSGNLIVRNTCSGNTNDWVISPDNTFGAVLDRRSVSSALVNGFSAASSMASSDPNANVSY